MSDNSTQTINTAELADKLAGIIEDLTAIHATLTGDEEDQGDSNNQDSGDTKAKGAKSTADQFANAMNKAFGN